MVPKGNGGPKAQAKQKPPLLSAPPSRRREWPPNFVRGRERPPPADASAPHRRRERPPPPTRASHQPTRASPPQARPPTADASAPQPPTRASHQPTRESPPPTRASPPPTRAPPPNFVRGRERPPTPPTRAPYTADVSVPRLESTVAVKGNQRRRSHKARRGQAPAMGSRPVGCAEFWASASAARRGGIPHEIVRSVQNFRLFLVMMLVCLWSV